MGLSHSPKIVTDKLICCLDAGNTKSYSGSGSTWTDMTGNGNNFTITGATYNSGPGRFTFGDNESDRVSASGVIGGLADVSFSIWLRWTTLPTNAGLISYATTTNDNEFLIFKNSTSFEGWLGANSVVFTGFSNADWDAGNWLCFTVTRKENTLKFYKNGEFKVQTTSYFTGAIGTGGTLVFGQEQDSPGGGFDTGQDFPGDIASIKIYEKQLSDSEVYKDFNALRGRFGV